MIADYRESLSAGLSEARGIPHTFFMKLLSLPDRAPIFGGFLFSGAVHVAARTVSFLACSTFVLGSGSLLAGTFGPLTYTDTGNSITIDACANVPEGVVIIPPTIDGKPVDTIGPAAFADNTVWRIQFPESITRIGERAFDSCVNLSYVTMPLRVSQIEPYTFRGCRSLEFVTLDESGLVLTSIGTGAFAGSGVVGADIPDSVVSMGSGVFENCPRIYDVKLSHNITFLGDRTFKNTPSLRIVHLPSKLTGIGEEAFYNSRVSYKVMEKDDDSDYHEFDLGRSPLLTTIGARAFASCYYLSFFKLPPSVKEIGTEAFAGCVRLSSMVFTGNAPQLGTGVFDGAASDFKVFVTATAEGYTFPKWYGYRILRDAPEISVFYQTLPLRNGAHTVDLGITRIGHRTKRELMVRNIGNRKLTGVTYRLTGANAKDFFLSSTGPKVVYSNQYDQLRVHFKPRGRGKRTATLEIRSNDKNEKVFRVKLKAEGNHFTG